MSPGRFISGFARLAIVGAMIAGLGDCDGIIPHACPAACIGASFATFDLSCSPNDLVSVTATGPCAKPDAGLAWYTGSGTEWSVSVGSPVPGTCHIVLTFASGFTYAKDVTFTSQTTPSDPGCPGCPPFIAPTSGPFTVNNPSSTCVDAGPDRSDAGDAD